MGRYTDSSLFGDNSKEHTAGLASSSADIDPDYDFILIYNPLTVTLYANTGEDSATATVITSSFIPPGSARTFRVTPGHNKIAFIVKSDAGIILWSGEQIV